MNALQPKIEAIQAVYPHFLVDNVQTNQEGQYNDVLIINEQFVFRFPRYEVGLEQLALETKILTAIQPAITLPIPNPVYQNFGQASIGEAFMGYRRLVGEPLWLPVFKGIEDEAVLDCLGVQLAQFLQELHQLPTAGLLDEPLPLCDTREEWDDVYGRVQTKLFPFMRIDACQAVAAHFEEMLEGPGFNYTPCLRHGDFGTGNILYDPQSQHISGVIDFGFTTLGDPAIDFAGLLTFGEPFVKKMEETHPALGQYWERIWFYRGTFALLEALFGLEQGDEAAFHSGLSAYV